MNIRTAGGHSAGSRWPLTGRSGELEAVGQAWADRRCRAVVVCGPAGVGKSRLAEEVLAQVVREGWRAGRATATAAAAAVPLGALAHLIPSKVDLSDPVSGFAQVARVLAGPQRDRRWAVLVDDLHLLDAASAVLLRQLLDAGVVRLIATVRSGEPAGEAVQALTGGDAVHRVDLGPFDPSQLEQVLRAALGGPVGRRTLHILHAASEGNALYVRELVLGALAAGTLASDGEIWELEGELPATPKLAELIGVRLAAASDRAREVLELLALCEPVPLADVEAVASLEVLEGLEEEGLVRVVTDRRRATVTLAHPLYGEVLRGEVPASRRRVLLLEQVERTRACGARRRDDALHLATWQMAATGTADPQLLLQAATLARHAHDYQRVDTLMQALPTKHHSYASCRLHGDGLVQMGHWQRADELLAKAEALAVGEIEQAAATLVRTWNLFWIGGDTEQALSVNGAARAHVTDPVGRHLLTINEGLLLAVSGHPAQGLALLEDLEPDIRDAPDAGLWAVAAMCKTAGLSCLGRTEDAIRWGQQAHTMHSWADKQAFAAPHPVFQLNPLISALADDGQLAKARATTNRALADTVEADIAWPRVWEACFRGRVEWLAGDMKAARRWYAEAIAQGRAHHQIRPLFPAWAGLAAAAALLGDLASAEGALKEMRHYPAIGLRTGEEALGQAWLFVARGRLADARTVLTEAGAKARKTQHATSEALLLTDIARLGGAKEVASRLAELAQACDGDFAPARAHLAAALATDDPEKLLAAARELEAIGAYLLAAEAATAAATAWQRTGQSRRATAAGNLAIACANHCPGVSTPLLTAPSAAAPLTPREREIALLAAVGTSSKDIATILHLSVRTVDNHLQRAYAKLGVTTRRELAATLDTTPNRHFR